MGASKSKHRSLAAGLAGFDRAARKLEVSLGCVVLLFEVVVLVSWVVLKGLSSPTGSESGAGWVIRALLGAIALGGTAAFVMRTATVRRRAVGVVLAMGVGVGVASLWRGAFVGYTSNLLNWLQQASALTLFGGLRGIGTRLTVLLLFVGGALATGRGRHITIDLLTRSLGPSLRRFSHITSNAIAGVVCMLCSWGFFDHIAIEDFHTKLSDTAGFKVETVVHGVSEHAYALRRQIELDARSFVSVALAGRPYAEWLSGAEWNAFVGTLAERYGAEAASSLRIGPLETRAPMVVIPGVGEPRGELVKTANLVFPFGFAWLAARFLLLSMRLVVDPSFELDSSPPEGAVGEGRA